MNTKQLVQKQLFEHLFHFNCKIIVSEPEINWLNNFSIKKRCYEHFLWERYIWRQSNFQHTNVLNSVKVNKTIRERQLRKIIPLNFVCQILFSVVFHRKSHNVNAKQHEPASSFINNRREKLWKFEIIIEFSRKSFLKTIFNDWTIFAICNLQFLLPWHAKLYLPIKTNSRGIHLNNCNYTKW